MKNVVIRPTVRPHVMPKPVYTLRSSASGWRSASAGVAASSHCWPVCRRTLTNSRGLSMSDRTEEAMAPAAMTRHCMPPSSGASAVSVGDACIAR
jgi:hypothetical protein